MIVIQDSNQRYGSLTRIFHWLMTFLILWQFLKFFDRIDEGEHWVGETLVPWHISIGALLLVLIVLRIFWALSQYPKRPRHHGPSALLVKSGHMLLYLCMALLPLTGILYMYGNGYGLEVFGLELIAERETEIDWALSLGSLHSPLAWLFLALVVGHSAAAIYHHIIARDDTLARMTTGIKPPATRQTTE